jgi:excisionase family DNA binding protein
MDPDILDVKGAAKCLGVSCNCIYLLARRGKIPVVKVGKVWRFHRQKLLNWIASGTEQAQLESILKNVRVAPGK